MADAGPDQTSNVLVGDVVILDGSASSDAEGDTLTYRWSLVVAPAGSLAELSDPTAADPSFIADQSGRYAALLIVSDGFASSAPDVVNITAVIPPPVVSITAPEDLSVVTASPVTVTGTVDDPNATITVNGAAAANTNGSYMAGVAVQEGGNTITVVAQNTTGEGRASVEVILNTAGAPAVSIWQPKRNFLVGAEFDVGAMFAPAQVTVRGLVKVNTTSFLPAGNKPTVMVNDVAAEVVRELLIGPCGFVLPNQCWSFSANVVLDRGIDRDIVVVATDQANPPRSTTGVVSGTVDYCRKVWVVGTEPDIGGEDPGVTALAGLNNNYQNNRCHEIDGCSLGSGQLDDNPMGLTFCNLASTEFGRGTAPPQEFFVHGLTSVFDKPCNHHDVCYQTCVPVNGMTEAQKEEAWRRAYDACNGDQFEATKAVCRRAYPNPVCPVLKLPASCPPPGVGGCATYLRERARCFTLAGAYFLGVKTSKGFDKFKERQQHYCAK